jgi:hypothetical protein
MAVTEHQLFQLAASAGVHVQRESRHGGTREYWYLRKWAQTGQGRKGGRPVAKLFCAVPALRGKSEDDFHAAVADLDQKVADVISRAQTQPPTN